MTMNKRQYTNPEKRKIIYEKFNGHCAYCGKEIEYTDMQVDHVKPLRLGGNNDINNLFPSCRRCNHYKRGNSLEGFRTAIETIPIKLFRDNYIYKVGIDYGLLPTGKQSIKFYFEQQKEKGMNKHEIKILPEYFELIATPHGGVKRFELRKNDRDYKAGDVVTLKEWTGTEYTGNEITVGIKYVLKDCPEYGLMDGYCIFGW